MAALSELEAVNLMLRAIGEAPVNSLDPDETVSEAGVALSILTDTSREIQELGWHWNTEDGYDLVPDEDGFITLGANVSRVDIDPEYQTEYPNVIQRGDRLYDKDDHTYVFTETLKATVQFYLEWSELPPVAKRYIALRAARLFQQSVVGSRELSGFTLNDELEAKSRLMSAEVDTGDYTIFSNYDAARPLMRRY